MHATSDNLLTGWGNERVFGFPTEEGIFVLKKADGGYRLYSETGERHATGYMWRDTNPEFSTFTAPTMTYGHAHAKWEDTALAGFLSYDTWRADRMGDLPGADSARDADPDRDGLNNFLEYTFDLDPRGASRAPFSLTRDGSADLIFKWRRAPSRKDAVVTPQLSGDLQQWGAPQPGFSVQSVTLMTDGTEEVAVRLPAGAELERSNFVRLDVEPQRVQRSLKRLRSCKTKRSNASGERCVGKRELAEGATLTGRTRLLAVAAASTQGSPCSGEWRLDRPPELETSSPDSCDLPSPPDPFALEESTVRDQAIRAIGLHPLAFP